MADKMSSRKELELMNTLLNCEEWTCISTFITSQIESCRGNLESIDPVLIGRIGYYQGQIAAFKSILSRPQARINSLAARIDDAQEKINKGA